MDLWPDHTKISLGSIVIRLVKITPQHYPPGAEKPLPVAFKPTARDAEDGRQRNLQPLFSVWDSALISVADAKHNLLLEMTGDVSTSSYVGFLISADTVHGIDVEHGCTPVSVHRDPDTRNGVIRGHAHAGIQGLYYPENASKQERLRIKAIWAKLRDECKKAPDDYVPRCYESDTKATNQTDLADCQTEEVKSGNQVAQERSWLLRLVFLIVKFICKAFSRSAAWL